MFDLVLAPSPISSRKTPKCFVQDVLTELRAQNVRAYVLKQREATYTHIKDTFRLALQSLVSMGFEYVMMFRYLEIRKFMAFIFC